jgi:hypothetical protein
VIRPNRPSEPPRRQQSGCRIIGAPRWNAYTTQRPGRETISVEQSTHGMVGMNGMGFTAYNIEKQKSLVRSR